MKTTTTNETQNYFNQLPTPILVEIVSYLDAQSKANFSIVNKQIYEKLINPNYSKYEFWNNLLGIYFPEIDSKNMDLTSLRETFIEKYRQAFGNLDLKTKKDIAMILEKKYEQNNPNEFFQNLLALPFPKIFYLNNQYILDVIYQNAKHIFIKSSTTKPADIHDNSLLYLAIQCNQISEVSAILDSRFSNPHYRRKEEDDHAIKLASNYKRIEILTLLAKRPELFPNQPKFEALDLYAKMQSFSDENLKKFISLMYKNSIFPASLVYIALYCGDTQLVKKLMKNIDEMPSLKAVNYSLGGQFGAERIDFSGLPKSYMQLEINSIRDLNFEDIDIYHFIKQNANWMHDWLIFELKSDVEKLNKWIYCRNLNAADFFRIKTLLEKNPKLAETKTNHFDDYLYDIAARDCTIPRLRDLFINAKLQCLKEKNLDYYNERNSKGNYKHAIKLFGKVIELPLGEPKRIKCEASTFIDECFENKKPWHDVRRRYPTAIKPESKLGDLFAEIEATRKKLSR